jgi:endoglucanase
VAAARGLLFHCRVVITRALALAVVAALALAPAGCDEPCSRCASAGEPDGGPGPSAGDGGGVTSDGLPLPGGDATSAPDATIWPTPAEQILRLGHGINLGNMLEAPNEGEWGVTVKQPYLELIADAGFDSVRIPIRWSAHAATSAPYAIDATFAARVDEVVGWALAQNLTTIINIHHYDEIHSDPSGHKDRFLALWSQIAQRYKDASPRLVLELLNEPNNALTASIWNQYLAEALAEVRKTNPERTVLVGSGSWNSIGSLADLTLPADDNLIVTVHFYSPFWFTHSGADWVTPTPATGAVWNGDQAQQDELKKELQVASDWSSQHGVPVHVGEFGAYSAADHASRVKWTAFVVSELNQRGFAWSYWEFCSGFGAYDPDAEAWRSDLLGALSP